MKAKTLFLGGILFIGTIVSCEQRTLEDEVDDVCSCIQKAESEREFERCYDKMEEISDKYAFDPKAAEDVKKRLRDCVTN
mmetsp:Transcript_37313/g.49073  ORF Transcript_37313/g.49073 Transcript_37313/m.49073 type:complete len:80 (-) Transcript_37313:1004-1243(-)